MGINPKLLVTSTYPELQNWTGGPLKPIELKGMSSRFTKIHKKAHKQKWLKNWTILKNLKEKKSNQISALFSRQRPSDDWLDALDDLGIGLVDNKYTKLGKTSENLLLSQGLSYIKIPLC